ncbi:hypothetical protein [Motiliproteus sp. SC1-56]|uniref:hypothetical protein n=1 Tax=Motiliproteus sp. SC1-56 TaxID=2799565 RepID=UPI001A8FA7C0|nr:hypothetical protein [Motiliproteus sp. SC1-56]
MTKYPCRINRPYYKDGSRNDIHTYLVKQIHLPFIPQVGMEVRAFPFHAGPFENVVWDMQDSFFDIFVQGVDPSQLTKGESLEKRIEVDIEMFLWELQR